MYTKVLFDLDGTLIDTAPGIKRSMCEMLRIMGLPPINDEQQMALIGPPLKLGFSRILGLSGDTLDEAIRIYREIMPDIARGIVKPFNGVPELLRALKNSGRFIGVITSKQQSTAREHLEDFALWTYIDYLSGALPDGSGEKTELLKAAATDIGFDASTVMIGDRFYDLDAAKAVGIASIGVKYGYAPEGEIDGCAPTYTVNTVEELTELLLYE